MPQTATVRTRESMVYVAVFLVLWGGLMLGGQQLLNDDDTIWHSAVGREILQRRSFPQVDEYSCTFQGQPWIAHQWMGECLLAIARQWAGWTGVVATTALFLSALGTWVIGRLRVQGCDLILALLLLVVGFSAAAVNIVARPHLGTLALMGLVFAQLTDVERGRMPLNRFLWFIPLTVLWANLHGGVLGGLGTIGVVFLGWSLLAMVRRTSEDSAAGSSRESPSCGPLQSLGDLGRVWIVFGCCLLATLATPYGWKTLATWQLILGSNLQTLIVEHAPLDLRRLEGLSVALLAGLYFGLLLTLRQRPRVTWLVPIVWLILTISRIRHGSLFAIVTLISIADMTPHTRVGQWLGKRSFWSPDEQHDRKCPWPVVAAVMVLLLMGVRPVFTSYGDVITPPPSIWPPSLVEEIRRRSGQQVVHVFNGFDLAGAVIDQCPNARVFIDSRCELYGEAFLRAYVDGQRQPQQIDQWADQYDLQLALVEDNSGWHVHLQQSSRWRLIASAAGVSLFQRESAGARSGRNHSLCLGFIGARVTSQVRGKLVRGKSAPAQDPA